MSASELDDLIARVSALTGPDAQVDDAVYRALRPVSTPKEHKEMYDRGEVDAYWYWMSPFKYTASLDSVLALAERVLPEATWLVISVHSEPTGRIFKGAVSMEEAWAPTPAIALLLALLRALKAKDQSPA